MVGQQGLADRASDKPANGPLVAEFHLALSGVDIDVDQAGRHFEKQAAHRVAALHEAGVIAFEHGVMEAAVVDGTAVDEQVLIFSRGAGDARSADESP